MPDRLPRRGWRAGLACVVLVYLHNALPFLTTMPRVNVDEPWLMERAYQVLTTGVPSQPMLGLHQAYMLQVGYGYLVAPWLGLFGVGLFQARLLGVLLGLGVVMMVAAIGKRTVDDVTGLAAALFLAVDSNFLGGARNARTDIPSVFFIAVALTAYLSGRQLSRAGWFAVSGAALGLAMLCHSNAFWAGAILAAWYLLDYGWRGLVERYGYAFAAGLAATFGPYLAVVGWRWRDVQVQIGNFAGDRVPGWRPSFVWQQILLERQRYANWYFGLVTNAVPNPLLWTFELMTAAGLIALTWRAWSRRSSAADPNGPARLLILAAGAAFIFAGFINNKALVYIPHLLLGFSLAAGFAISEGSRLVPALAPAAPLVLAAYGLAGVAYYEKWYSSARKSELTSYEATSETLHLLVPPGAKYLYASPQFWTPFHADSGTAFYSYAAAQPLRSGDSVTLAGATADRPIFLVVDELQWLPELTTSATSSPGTWQQAWIDFIERQCALQGVAYGTAYGTLALYRCGLTEAPGPPPRVRIVGGTEELAIGDVVLRQNAEDLARWDRYTDPRQTTAAGGGVSPEEGGLRIHGAGWPGIVSMAALLPGERYLVSPRTTGTRDGDLLYLGTWQQPQVRSLAGASSSGIPARLVAQPWFPGDRAFIATAAAVRILVYSEAPSTDFSIRSLDIFRLRPATADGL